jgi:hypothetical protein
MHAPVNPADFLRIVAGLGVRGDAAANVARLLGYELAAVVGDAPDVDSLGRKRPVSELEAPLSHEKVDVRPSADALEDQGEVPAVVEAVHRAPTTGEPSWWAETEPLGEEAPGQAWFNPPPPPLFAPERQRDILQALARRRRRGRRVDVLALARLVARHEPYAELPRLSHSGSARQLAIVALRSPFVETFALDVEELARQAQSLLGREAVSVQWWSEVGDELPKAELVLLVARPRARTEGEVPLQAWFPAVKRARAAGSSVFLLSPETLVNESWRPLRTVEWSRRTRAANLHQRYAPGHHPRSEDVATLAALLAPAVRVEPALLRSVRLELLPECGPELEAQLTLSRYVASANGLGITFRVEKRAELLAGLMAERAPGPRRKRAFELIERAHAAAAPVQRLEERITRWQYEREGDWQNSIRSALRQATKALSRQRSGLARWVARSAKQLPDALRAHDAFVEAATRAGAVLGQALPHLAEAAGLSVNDAAFLGTLPDAVQPDVEVLLLDPESEPLRPEELDSPRELEVLAHRLGVTVPWLRSKLLDTPATSIHVAWLRRELRRELGRVAKTPVAVCLDHGAPGMSQVHALFEGLKGYDVSFVPPRALEQVLERSKVVFLDFDDPNKALLLQRAAEDPTFLGVFLADRRLVAAETEAVRALVEVVETRAEQVNSELRQLLALTGQGTGLRVVSRRATAGTVRHTLPLPAAMIPSLGYSNSTKEPASGARSNADLVRQAFTIRSGADAIANVHVLSELWLARLGYAVCVLQGEGGFTRSACLVERAYAVTRAGGTEHAPALEAGDRISLRLLWGQLIPASVVSVAGELAIVHIDTGEVTSSLPLEDDPPASGLAIAALSLDPNGLPELYWGWAQTEEDGSCRLVIQRPSLNKVSPEVRSGGLAVMIEGRYAGHATELTQGADGAWTARVCRAPKHLLAVSEEGRPSDQRSVSPSPWAPPAPPSGSELTLAIDPRVVREHRPGQLPSPRSPSPPIGWVYLSGAVSRAQTELATRILQDASAFEMGSFVQAIVEGHLVGARVEWHERQGATGRRGSFRGVSLFVPEYVPAGGSLRLGSEGQEVQRWQAFLKQQGYSSVVVDGRFGRETAARTRDFQKTQKLVADGIVGNATYRAARHLGFDPNADVATPDGLIGWTVLLAGVPTDAVKHRATSDLQHLTGETLRAPPRAQGSSLQFRTTRSALDTLLRRRRTGRLTELAGLPIVWLAEEQREPDDMDPQRGRFGSLPERNGRRLTAHIQRDGKRYLVALTVSSIGSVSALTGMVVFHLHPTFKQARYRVPVESGRATLELDVWGWFTVGVECDDGTRLELDLGDVPRPDAAS